MTSLGNLPTHIAIIDSAFNVNVQLTGYDYERNNVREKTPGARINKDLVDASVVESHIVPHRLLFTSHAPTGKFKELQLYIFKFILKSIKKSILGLFSSDFEKGTRSKNVS